MSLRVNGSGSVQQCRCDLWRHRCLWFARPSERDVPRWSASRRADTRPFSHWAFLRAINLVLCTTNVIKPLLLSATEMCHPEWQISGCERWPDAARGNYLSDLLGSFPTAPNVETAGFGWQLKLLDGDFSNQASCGGHAEFSHRCHVRSHRHRHCVNLRSLTRKWS